MDYWTAVWHNADHHVTCLPQTCPKSGQYNPSYDGAAEWAIEKLVEAGYTPDQAESFDVSHAQTHLTLAAMFAPTLMDTADE